MTPERKARYGHLCLPSRRSASRPCGGVVMDDDTRNYLDALDRLANGPTHQDRSVAAADLHALGVKPADLGREPGDGRG